MELAVKPAAAKLGNGKHTVTMLLGTWMIVGVFVDGLAHNEGVVESFFTPWHALLYTGFLACAAWILTLTLQNRKAGQSGWLESVPEGYGLGAAGAIVFLLGGVFDMIWHIVFGIEKNIAALLSPTHLVLLVGALLILTSPYRAISRQSTDDAPTFVRVLPALASIALTFAVMGFFLMYAWSFNYPLWMASEDDAVARAILNFLITTILLVAPLQFTLKRWRMPFGAVTFYFLFIGFLMTVLEGLRTADSLLVLLISGIAGDYWFRSLQAKKAGPMQYRIVFLFLPVLIWSLYFLGLAMFYTLNWAPELWAGAICLSGLASFGLSILASSEREVGRQ